MAGYPRRRRGGAYPWGGMVDDDLAGPTHQHFFNVRLHMDVDDGGDSVTEHEFHLRPWGNDNPYGNAFDTTARTLSRELDAARIADGQTGRYRKSPLMLAQEEAFVRRRGGFATRHLWVTPFDPAERYARGDYPNVHAGGDGLSRYIRRNRPIEDRELVVWHSFGHTQVCKLEDFPVMPVEYAGFMLKPNGFFAANAALDVPRERDVASTDGRGPAATLEMRMGIDEAAPVSHDTKSF